MDFTDVYKANLARFSPCGRRLATIVQHRLVIRDSETLQILHLFNNPSQANYLEWSGDGLLILCAAFSNGKYAKDGRGWVRAYQSNADQNDQKPWEAQIDEGVAGLSKCCFSPDGRHILCWSEFQLRITIWNLMNGESYLVRNPKFSDRGFAFRSDGRYFAFAERLEGKDHLSIVDIDSDWKLVKHFPVQSTDLEEISWSPDGKFLAIQECLFETKVYIYTPDGRLVHVFSTPDTGVLGHKLLRWSPSSQFLAICSIGQSVKILNCLTWSVIIELEHLGTIVEEEIPVYKELCPNDGVGVQTRVDETTKTTIRFKTQYTLSQKPATLIAAKVEPDSLPFGITVAEWSPDGRYFVTKSDLFPTTLFIFDILELKYGAVLTHATPVRLVAWNPSRPDQLAFCCQESNSVYIWSPNGSSSIPVPVANFEVCKVMWNPNGRSIATMNKEKFSTGFLLESQY